MGWAKTNNVAIPGVNIVASSNTKKMHVGTYIGNPLIGSQDKTLGVGDIKPRLNQSRSSLTNFLQPTNFWLVPS